ncbi:tRNA (guanosine(37)-N1)-methyltransferase TrmD [Armatimonas sp.]|uniref:tRNA (guanosine(37)-N1)-methyltransferase TrmD n=1 Tax=Armatimonas sp. TaxID=1872638 RepID=UPI00286ABF31|nr:tRNA (guanosine(37)-N1)-methyltransferase TrmD [Armatimonas sp.]
MRVDVVTLFPELILQATSHSIVQRAQVAGSLELDCVNPRDFTHDRHRTVDDCPFGGGAGMVMKAEPLVAAIESATKGDPSVPVLLTAPDGEPFTQALAQELATLPRWVVVCGHYEGIDERVREGWITREVSLGDYVLTGGELAALVMLDATVRLLPGVLGNEESAQEESFEGGVLEYPHYTRPAVFRGRGIPEVLTSGHHANVAKWRRTQALVRTRARRPDLWEKLLPLGKADQKLLDAYNATEAQVRVEPCSARVDEPVSNPE